MIPTAVVASQVSSIPTGIWGEFGTFNAFEETAIEGRPTFTTAKEFLHGMKYPYTSHATKSDVNLRQNLKYKREKRIIKFELNVLLVIASVLVFLTVFFWVQVFRAYFDVVFFGIDKTVASEMFWFALIFTPIVIVVVYFLMIWQEYL